MKKITNFKALFLGIITVSVFLTSCDTKTTETPITKTFVDSLDNTTWIATGGAIAPGAAAFLGSDYLTIPEIDTFTVTKLNATTLLFKPNRLESNIGDISNFNDTVTVDLTSNIFKLSDYVATSLFKDSTPFFVFDSFTTPAYGFSGGLYDSLKGLTDSLGIALYFKWTGSLNPNATGAHKNYLFAAQNASTIGITAPFSISLKIYKNKFKNPGAALFKNKLLATLFTLVLGGNAGISNQTGFASLTIPNAAVIYGFVKK